MSYLERERPTGLADLLVYKLIEYGTVYSHVPCSSSSRCSSCFDDQTIYKVCPGCGGKIDGARSQPYMCSCGMPLWVCRVGNESGVTIYAIPNPLFKKAEEDTI